MKMWQRIAALVLSGVIFAVPMAYSVYTSKATAPTATVVAVEDGVTQAVVGQLIRLKVEGSAAEWIALPKTDFEAYGDNRENCIIAFASGGEYHVIGASIVDGKVILQEFPINVDGAGAVVGPGKTANDWNSKVALWLKEVNSPNKTAEIAKVSQSFRSIANIVQKKLDAGQLVNLQEVMRDTATSNAAAVASNKAAWAPFQAQLNTELSTRAANGSLETMQQHATTWLQIADALDASL